MRHTLFVLTTNVTAPTSRKNNSNKKEKNTRQAYTFINLPSSQQKHLVLSTTLTMLFRTSAIFAFLVGSSTAFAPSSNVHSVSSTRLNLENDDTVGDDRRSFVTKTGSTVAATALATATGAFGGLSVQPQPAEAAATSMWKQVKLPFAETLYDIDFDT
jgi:hypothetical protein